jgi:PadR family transcriptional regulator
VAYKLEVEALILGALQDGPLHGYRISQSIKSKGEGLLKLGDNQIYPILHRLELEGLVRAEWQTQEGKPARKVYALTQEGGSRLETHRREWDRYVATFSALIASKEGGHA